MASSTRSALMWKPLPGTSRITMRSFSLTHSTAHRVEAGDAAVLAGEALGRNGEVAMDAFLVRTRGAQLERPVRPGDQLFLVLWRQRQDFELAHRARLVPVRRADAIRAGIAAADHQHVAAGRHDAFAVRHLLAGDATVLLRQEFHGVMDAGELAARHRQVARRFRADREHQRVVVAHQALDRDIHADMAVGMELDALGPHLPDAAIDDVLLELEVGNAVAQQAADARRLLEHGDVVAGAGELLRAGEAGGAGADHGDALAGAARGDLRLDPALGPAALDDSVLDRLDRHRLLDEVERAGGLARRRADAAGDIGEIIGLMQHLQRALHVVAVNEIVPVGDDVVDRAGVVAIGRAAIHAARALPAQLVIGQRAREFAPMLDAVGDRRVATLAPLELQEAGRFAHVSRRPRRR